MCFKARTVSTPTSLPLSSRDRFPHRCNSTSPALRAFDLIGVDEGGVKREFFQILVEELFDPQYGMWERNSKTGSYWFSSHQSLFKTEEDRRNYFLTGLALGLAIHNGVILNINFPSCMYKKLVHESVGLVPDLQELMPETCNGLLELLRYAKDDVDDVFSLNFAVTVTDFGDVKEHALIPGGVDIDVTQKNKTQYAELVAHYYLNDAVSKSFTAFARGFATLVDGKSFEFFNAEELDLLVAGETTLDFHALESSCLYEGGYDSNHKTIRFFWRVVHNLREEEKKKLLKFVTGCPRSPIGGLRNLRPPLKIQRHGPDSASLPQAATCFSTLLLPEYTTQRKLRKKLLCAIENCEGFGLK